MTLTTNLKRIGMAAHQERRDQRDVIDYQNHLAENRRREKFKDVLQAVRDTFETQAEYNEWWEAAPEEGFFEYAEEYLLKIMAQDRKTQINPHTSLAFITLNGLRVQVIVDATRETKNGTIARVYPQHTPEVPWIVRAEDIEVEA